MLAPDDVVVERSHDGLQLTRDELRARLIERLMLLIPSACRSECRYERDHNIVSIPSCNSSTAPWATQNVSARSLRCFSASGNGHGRIPENGGHSDSIFRKPLLIGKPQRTQAYLIVQP
jgi:hypothetical protein